jgi:hypothetical protein
MPSAKEDAAYMNLFVLYGINTVPNLKKMNNNNHFSVIYFGYVFVKKSLHFSLIIHTFCKVITQKHGK